MIGLSLFVGRCNLCFQRTYSLLGECLLKTLPSASLWLGWAGLGCITHMKTKREGQEGGRRREKQKGEGIEGSRGERGEN